MSRDYRVTPAVLEQRREAGRRSRPGRRNETRPSDTNRLPETPETIARDVSFGKMCRLTYSTAAMAERRVALEFRLLERVEKEVEAGKVTIAKAVKLLRGLMPIGELTAIMREAHDRAGLPRLSQLQVAADKALPVMVLPDRIPGWDEKEAHVPAASGGNGHALGDTEH